MKIRQGFVSNSSSSSFIIAVPKGTEPTVQNMHRVLYGDNARKEFYAAYDWHEGVNSYDVVDDIVRQINEGRYDPEVGDRVPGPVKDLIKAVEAPYSETGTFYSQCRLPEGDERGMYDWDKYEALCGAARARVAEAIIKKYPEHDFYEVEFEDDNQFGCEVEHGPALNQLPNVFRFSHH